MAHNVSLPAELVAAILDHADIHQLVVVSHVCALWRSAAHAHPVFWRNVTLNQLSLGAASLFEARLGSPRGDMGINVAIHSQTDTEHGRLLLTSIALPAIERSLSRIVRLSLLLPEQFLSESTSFLGHPAPMLTNLALAATKGPTYHIFPHIAERLFAGFAPEARTLELTNVRILDSTILCGLFYGIESLRLVCNSSIHLPGLLAHFPSLLHLDIYAEGCIQNHRDMPSISRPLLSLRLRLYYGDYDSAFICFTDLGQIAHLTCWLDLSYAPHTVSTILGVFDARPLKLTLLDNGAVRPERDFGIMFSSPRHSRTVCIQADDMGMRACRDHLRAHLLSPGICARVSHLRVPAPQISLTALIAEELSVCEVLEIALDDDGLPTPTPTDIQVLRVPYLRTVVFAASGRSTVSVSDGDLFAFLRPLVGEELPPLEIQRENIDIVGETASIPATFAHLSS